jgi:hypothetical protein
MLMLGCALVLLLGLSAVSAQVTIPTRAGTTVVFGWWDGTASQADQPGEVTFNLGSVVSGVLADSLVPSDTVVVGSVYSFSSMESLFVGDFSGAANYDTVEFKYWFQNQSNLATDSFTVQATVVDTSEPGHFTPTDFEILDDTKVPFGFTNGMDSAAAGIVLAEAATGTFYVRVLIPAIDSAADGDTIQVAVNVRGNKGTGADDNWPWGKEVFDTLGIYLHTNSGKFMDFGDTQVDTVFIAVGGPVVRVLTRTTLVSGSAEPGDTMVYTVYYDNDGSAPTPDSGFVVAYLPEGAAFMDTLQGTSGNGNPVTTSVQCYGMWIDHIPITQDSLLRITAMKYAIPPGINAQSGGDGTGNLADDSTDVDAGMVKFRVRIR